MGRVLLTVKEAIRNTPGRLSKQADTVPRYSVVGDGGRRKSMRWALRFNWRVLVAAGLATVLWANLGSISPAAAATPVATPNISAPPDILVGDTDGYVDLPVTLSAPGTSTVTVAYATANSTAASSSGCNYNYVGVSGTLTFTPGQTTQVVRVDLLNCPVVNRFLSFTFNLSSPTNAAIVRPSTRIGIVSDGNATTTPGLYVRSAVVDNTAGSISVPVLLGGPAGTASTSTVTVVYATHDGTAKAGSDYTATSGTLTFGPGETVQNIVVPIIDRSGSQPSRNFTVSLSSPTNSTIVQGTGTVTIGASGATPVATPNISAPPDILVGDTDGYVDLPVTLSAPGTSTVTVAYTTDNSTAASSSGCNYNYVGVSGTLTFTPGQTTQVVRVDLLNCPVVNNFLSFTFNLSSPTNAAIVRPSTRIGIVSDGNATTTPGLYVRSAVVDNTAGSISVPVLLGGPAGTASTSTVTVAYATHDGTAKAGSDYTATSGTLTFGPGETVQNIVVPIIDRSGSQPSRNFTVSLSSPTNSTIVQGTGTVTIGASGATPVATPNISAPPDILVGDTDGYVDLPVTLSAPGTSTVTVAYATDNSTAASSSGCNYNYVGVSGTLTFTPGQTTQVVRVDLLNCPVVNNFLSFTFNLSSPTNAAIVRPSTRIGIVSDGNATTTPGLYVRSAVVDNTAGSISVPVLLGGPAGTASTSTVTVAYATHDGTAKAGSDYTATSGTLTFGPGETVQNIVVPIIDRSGSQPSRNFTVSLSSPTNSTIVQGTGTVTIGASGATPVATPNISAPPDILVGDTDGYVDLPVTLSAPGTSTVTVAYTTDNSTAASSSGCNYNYVGVSGTLTFTPGQTTQVVRVDLLNCPVVNNFLSFTFNLSSPTNAAIVRPSTRIGIVSDGNATTTPGLYVRSAVVDNTAGSISVPVLLGGPAGTASTSTVTVAYATHDGTAKAGSDYTATSGTLTFGPGETVQNIVVPIIDRSGSQPSRNFTVSLSSPTNSTIVQGTGTVTIGASGATPVATPNISAPPDTIPLETDGYVDLPVTLSAPGTSTVTVAYTTDNGTAASSTGCNYNYVGVSGTLTFTPGQTTQVVRVDLLSCDLAGLWAFTFNLSSPTNAAIVQPSTTVTISSGPPVFQGASPPLHLLNGTTYNAVFHATDAPTYALVGAPGWLTISATGAVTGTPPSGTQTFSFGVSATAISGQSTAGPYTVTVLDSVPVTGTVVSGTTPIAGVTVQSCEAVTGDECNSTTSSSDGTFTVLAAAGASVVLHAYPPQASGFKAASNDPVTVPAGGLTSQTLLLQAAGTLPAGLVINGSSTPSFNWAVPTPVTLTGCAGGFAAVSAIVRNTVTGNLDVHWITLSENPPDSGHYVGTLPPLVPDHGSAQFDDMLTSAPEGSVLPPFGPANGGTTVVLSGSGFTGATGVEFGGTPATTFTVLADDTISAIAPPGTGTVEVTVSVGGSSQDIGPYTYQAIQQVSPSIGSAGGGTEVVIAGTGLSSAQAVLFGNTPAAFSRISDTEIEAIAPAGSGAQDIQVVNEWGATSTPSTVADHFTYAPGPPETPPPLPISQPIPESPFTQALTLLQQTVHASAKLLEDLPLSPEIAVIAAIVDAGVNPSDENILEAATEIASWGFAEPIEALSSSLAVLELGRFEASGGLLAATLAKAQNGNRLAGLLLNATGAVIKGSISEDLDMLVHFLVGKYLEAKFYGKSFLPNGWVDPSGTVLDTNGNPISGATVTILRSSTATGPYAAVSSSSSDIEPATNPETTGADGVFHWDVTSGYYEIQASAPSCVDPSDSSASSVTIGPYPVPPPQVGLTITLQCPNEAPPSLPTVTSLSQVSGPAAGGTVLTVQGSGFTPQSTVAFGTSIADDVTYLSPSSLLVTSPVGSGLTDVVVEGAGGASPTSAADQFYFGTTPTVSELSSSHGPLEGGSTLTITGSGFLGATGVLFGTVAAPSYTVLSDTKLIVTVPHGAAGIAPVTVDNPAGASANTAVVSYLYVDNGGLTAVGPSRVLATASKIGASGPLGSHKALAVSVLGKAGVPASGVADVIVDVTASGGQKPGSITVYRDGTTRPGTPNVNFATNQTVANLAVVPVGTNGKIDLYNSAAGTVQLDADIQGWIASGTPAAGGLTAVGPSRVLATASKIGASGPLGSHKALAVSVLGKAGVPASGVADVIVDVTASGGQKPGSITVYRDGTTRPGTPNVNFATNQTVANLAVVPVGTNGKIDLYNSAAGTVQLDADIQGWIASGTPAAGGLTAVGPSRVLATASKIGASGPLGSHKALAVSVLGKAGVPASGVADVIVDVTASGGQKPGSITVYRDGTTRPGTPNVNFATNQTVANLAVVPVGTNGNIDLYNSAAGTVQLDADIQGWIAS